MVEQFKTLMWVWPPLDKPVYVGFPIEIRLVLENYTNTTYPKYEILIKVNGVEHVKEVIKLGAGNRPFKQYHYTPTKPGKYVVSCNDKIAEFNVEAMPNGFRTLTVKSGSKALSTQVSGIPIVGVFEASREVYKLENVWGFTVFPGETLTCPVRNDAAWRWQPLVSIVPSSPDVIEYWVINGTEKPSRLKRLLYKPQTMIWVGMSNDNVIEVVEKVKVAPVDTDNWRRKS